jgi:SAM-dependent methyltransferase
MPSEADYFSPVASAYAECRPGYPGELFSYLAALIPRHELAWDCAAGSGQASLPLASYFRRVIATDLSAAMLEHGPRHPRVEYRVAPAEHSGLADGSTDLVTVAQALHWLDTDRFYQEVDRVLPPGGALAVWSYGNQRLGDPRIDALLSRFYSQVVGPYWPPERRHVEAGYRTLAFPYPELEPPALALEERWNMGQLLGYVRTWSATQRFQQEKGFDPVSRLDAELRPLWQDPRVVRLVRWPLSLRVGYKPI